MSKTSLWDQNSVLFDCFRSSDILVLRASTFLSFVVRISPKLHHQSSAVVIYYYSIRNLLKYKVWMIIDIWSCPVRRLTIRWGFQVKTLEGLKFDSTPPSPLLFHTHQRWSFVDRLTIMWHDITSIQQHNFQSTVIQVSIQWKMDQCGIFTHILNPCSRSLYAFRMPRSRHSKLTEFAPTTQDRKRRRYSLNSWGTLVAINIGS